MLKEPRRTRFSNNNNSLINNNYNLDRNNNLLKVFLKQINQIHKKQKKVEQPEVKSTQNLRKLVMVNKRENQKTSKLILNHNAIKFKVNIEDAIKAQVLELKENSAEAKKLKAGARYECIYKNLLRDIRQFFSNNFEKFIQTELGKSYKTL